MDWQNMGKRGRPKHLASSQIETLAKESRKEGRWKININEKLKKASSQNGSIIAQARQRKNGSIIDTLNERYIRNTGTINTFS